jgi:hypothetical protein
MQVGHAHRLSFRVLHVKKIIHNFFKYK